MCSSLIRYHGAYVTTSSEDTLLLSESAPTRVVIHGLHTDYQHFDKNGVPADVVKCFLAQFCRGGGGEGRERGEVGGRGSVSWSFIDCTMTDERCVFVLRGDKLMHAMNV